MVGFKGVECWRHHQASELKISGLRIDPGHDIGTALARHWQGRDRWPHTDLEPHVVSPIPSLEPPGLKLEGCIEIVESKQPADIRATASPKVYMKGSVFSSGVLLHQQLTHHQRHDIAIHTSFRRRAQFFTPI